MKCSMEGAALAKKPRKGHLSDIVMSIYTGFCALVNVYFNDLQINRWLHLSFFDLSSERIDQKNLYLLFLLNVLLFFIISELH